MNNETEILEDLPVTTIEKNSSTKESVYSIFDENGRKIEIEETYKKDKKPLIVYVQRTLFILLIAIIITILFYLFINEPDLVANLF